LNNRGSEINKLHKNVAEIIEKDKMKNSFLINEEEVKNSTLYKELNLKNIALKEEYKKIMEV